MLELGTL